MNNGSAWDGSEAGWVRGITYKIDQFKTLLGSSITFLLKIEIFYTSSLIVAAYNYGNSFTNHHFYWSAFMMVFKAIAVIVIEREIQLFTMVD